jgi:hypothetical protein
VSVIGGRSDRAQTVRALQQAMPFVRHELGKRLRIRRIPDLHVKVDDSAERATRVLHLLNELEAGADPEAITPIDDSLPTPVRRLPHEGDADEPPDPPAAKAASSPVSKRAAHRGPGARGAGGQRPKSGSQRPRTRHG